MSKVLFVGARLKIHRANHHIDDLQRQFTAFVDSNPYTLSVHDDDQSGQQVLRLNFTKRINSDWALIIGDAIHNLRSSLDLMTWELVGRDGGEQDRYLKFPVGDSPTNFNATCNGIKTPSQAVKDIFQALEVFPGGKGNALHALHHLDIADKHMILMPVIRSANVSEYSIFDARGVIKQTHVNTTFIVGGTDPHFDIDGAPPGGSIHLDEDVKITPVIVLDKIAKGAPYLPIISVLRTTSRKVTEAIESVTLKVINAGL